VRGYATSLAQWWTFLEQRGEAGGWREVGVPAVMGFLSWLRNGRTVEHTLLEREDAPSPETLEARLAALISFYRWQEAVFAVPVAGRLLRGAPRRAPARGLLAHLDARSAPGPSSLVRVRRSRRRVGHRCCCRSRSKPSLTAAPSSIPRQRRAEHDALTRLLAALQAAPGRAVQGAGCGASATGPVPLTLDLNRHRIAEIRDNLTARIAEAEREGWPGEIEGLKISLADASGKLAQIDRRSQLPAPVDIGMPAFARTAETSHPAHGRPHREFRDHS